MTMTLERVERLAANLPAHVAGYRHSMKDEEGIRAGLKARRREVISLRIMTALVAAILALGVISGIASVAHMQSRFVANNEGHRSMVLPRTSGCKNAETADDDSRIEDCLPARLGNASARPRGFGDLSGRATEEVIEERHGEGQE
jgi:hypothetical protein